MQEINFLKGNEYIQEQNSPHSLNNLYFSKPKSRRFFRRSRTVPRIFGSKKSMRIYFSQLFRNFAAFDNK